MESIGPEHERMPESHAALSEGLQKPQTSRRERWKPYLYGMLFLLLAPVLLSKGIYFIQSNKKVLSSAMGITNLFPFFLVGLWGFLLLILTGLFCMALVQIVTSLNKSLQTFTAYKFKRASE
jgi:hypothetical protein